MAPLPQPTTLLFYCAFRQAERSVHFALSFPNEWSQLQQYYDGTRQVRLEKLIEVLKLAGLDVPTATAHKAAVRNSLFNVIQSAVLSIASRTAGALFTDFKCVWLFTSRELSFFHDTLAHVIKSLRAVSTPCKEELLQLRLDCFHCQYIIRRRLIFSPELAAANSIEHFGQSEYVRHVTFEEMGIQG